MIEKTIADIINEEYKNYAIEIVKQRAIPNLMDGFKPVQRKIFYILKNKIKNKKTKVEAIAGYVVAETNHHHGSTSVESAAIKMGKDFRCSGNNLPVMDRKGNFGSRLVNVAGAPRYIFGSFNKLMDSIFIDNEICIENRDPEFPEPEYYLPLIPMILINSSKGMAIGYAEDIKPYCPISIIDYIVNIFEKKPNNELLPHWKGQEFEVIKEDDKMLIKPAFKFINKKKILIEDLPIKYNLFSFLKKLNTLKENNEIRQFKNLSKDDDLKFEVTLNSQLDEEQCIKLFGLEQSISNNIVCIFNNKVYEFENVHDLIMMFLKIRLYYYKKRYIRYIEDLKEMNKFLYEKYDFIENMICLIESKGINISSDDLNKLVNNYDKKYKQKLLSLSIQNFNMNKLKDISNEIYKNDELIKEYLNIEFKEQYVKELKELKETLKKYFNK
jgi:DNA gyrase/topoisomerase IV subunit A